MRRILACLAPFVAVLIFWWGLRSARLTVLAYHVQILFWSRIEARTGGLAVPCCGHLLADVGIVLAAWVLSVR